MAIHVLVPFHTQICYSREQLPQESHRNVCPGNTFPAGTLANLGYRRWCNFLDAFIWKMDGSNVGLWKALFPPNKLDRKGQLQHVKGSADAKSWTRENSWWVGANLVQENVELIASRRAWGSTAVLAGH